MSGGPENNEKPVPSKRAEVVEVANKVIRGELSVLVGARRLTELQHSVAGAHDDDFTLFVVVESETDDLPLEAERAYWATVTLAEKDKEIVRAENLYKDQVVAACKTLVARFGGTV